jgi:hypothetical protein
VIRVVLAGATEEVRTRTAGLLAARLGLPASNEGDGFVLAGPPLDPVAFDAELARRGVEVDALIHLGGAPDAVLDHYGRAVIEAPDGDVDVILERLREAFATAAR